jgi:hypothetical protein
MATVYVEARPKGAQEGTRIDDYVVEDHADHVLKTTATQADAIKWANPPYSSAGVGSGFGGSSRYGDEAEARRFEAPFSARVVEACRS